MGKLWGGRFEKGLSESAKAFSYSLHIDKRLVQYDIKVNRAHAKALQHADIFTKEEWESVDSCLAKLAMEFTLNPDTLLGDDEDIHSCLERHVTERCGDLGKKLHTGKSRNDQVITDTRLFVKEATLETLRLLTALQRTFFELACTHERVIFPGFTHTQPAQPVLLSHHFLAYYEKFSRDSIRFEAVLEAADVCTLGSGALAGNNYKLDRVLVASELGFRKISKNSMDAVADRDFILDYLNAATTCMTHLSRISDELILFTSPAYGFFNLGDDFTTGSSIMPQKKNPDIAELIRGKTGRVLGNLVALYQALKGLPLTYHRDLQEDKEILFDSIDTLCGSLENMVGMLNTLTLNPEAIQKALKKGYLTATELADYLVKKEVPFREAHEITGKIIMEAVKNKKELQDLTLVELKQFSKKIGPDIGKALMIETAVEAKDVIGGTAFTQVASQLQHIAEEKSWKKP